MVLLPKGNQFVEVFRGNREHMPDVRLACVAGPDGVRPLGYLDSAVCQKIDHHYYFGIGPMYVPWRVIIWEYGEPNHP
jgi:hypothetical protein